jgi:hypothetical protein
MAVIPQPSVTVAANSRHEIKLELQWLARRKGELKTRSGKGVAIFAAFLWRR